jgi:hypothetical protein
MCLIAWWRLAPERWPPTTVVTDVQSENLLAHAKRSFLPSLAFDRLWQSQADCAQSLKMSLCHLGPPR